IDIGFLFICESNRRRIYQNIRILWNGQGTFPWYKSSLCRSFFVDDLNKCPSMLFISVCNGHGSDPRSRTLYRNSSGCSACSQNKGFLSLYRHVSILKTFHETFSVSVFSRQLSILPVNGIHSPHCSCAF